MRHDPPLHRTMVPKSVKRFPDHMMSHLFDLGSIQISGSIRPEIIRLQVSIPAAGAATSSKRMWIAWNDFVPTLLRETLTPANLCFRLSIRPGTYSSSVPLPDAMLDHLRSKT